VPPTLVDVEAKQIAHELWHEEHHDHHGHDHDEIEPTAEHTKLAERRVRLGLLLAELGNKHDITVPEADVQRAIFAQARQYPGQEREFLEFIQKNPQAFQQLRAPLFEDRVVDFILELAQVTETPVGKDELQKAIEALDDDAATLAAPAPEPATEA
jgi:trigger factor